MRLIIAGSRDMGRAKDSRDVTAAEVGRMIQRVAEMAEVFEWPKDSRHGVTRVLSGHCPLGGIDIIGEAWAQDLGIPVDLYPPKQERGETFADAAKRRNQEMVRNADALLVIRYPNSRGSSDVMRRARMRGLLVHDVVVVHRFDDGVMK